MRTLLIGCAALSLASGVLAQVETYSGSQIVNELGFANFNTLKYPDPLLGYTEGGMVVSINNVEFEFVQLDGTPSYYPNTGTLALIEISRADGLPLEALEFQVWNGFAQVDPTPVWAQAYLGGELVAEFDIGHPGPSQGFPVLGFKGRFDLLRIGGYFDDATRDLHDPSQLNAIALDNMRYGTIDGQDCYADCDGDGELSFFDFLCYTNAFNAGQKSADCDTDGELSFFDFLCFTNLFNAGC